MVQLQCRCPKSLTAKSNVLNKMNSRRFSVSAKALKALRTCALLLLGPTGRDVPTSNVSHARQVTATLRWSSLAASSVATFAQSSAATSLENLAGSSGLSASSWRVELDCPIHCYTKTLTPTLPILEARQMSSRPSPISSSSSFPC